MPSMVALGGSLDTESSLATLSDERAERYSAQTKEVLNSTRFDSGCGPVQAYLAPMPPGIPMRDADRVGVRGLPDRRTLQSPRHLIACVPRCVEGEQGEGGGGGGGGGQGEGEGRTQQRCQESIKVCSG